MKTCSKCKDYKYYGGRGIKCLIIEEEIKKLWFRDKAYLMKKPSIDRKENDGNYELDNCGFIEQSVNSIKNKEIPVLQYDLDNKFIQEFKSQSDASRILKTSGGDISRCCSGKRKTAGGFIWRIKCQK